MDRPQSLSGLLQLIGNPLHRPDANPVMGSHLTDARAGARTEARDLFVQVTISNGIRSNPICLQLVASEP